MNWFGIFLSTALTTTAAIAAEGAAAPGTNAVKLATISLPDQHNQPHTFDFPQPSVSVLTVADRKGSEQIEAWVKPLKDRYQEKLLVEGVADVSSVPAVLRSLVRKRFKEKFAHPVMLDWNAKIVRQLDCKPDEANIFVLATNGIVVFTLHGAADKTKLEQIYKVLDPSLPRTEIIPPATAAANIRAR